jgi:hypothetical protein
MGVDVLSQMMSLQAMRTQGLVDIAVLKKSHEMQMQLLQMLDEAVRTAPAARNGRKGRQDRLKRNSGER